MNEMSQYSDEQLWGVVNQRLSRSQSLRLRELSKRNKQGILSASEQIELNSIIDMVDRYMLARSEALLLLQQRGHDVRSYFKLGK